MTRTSPILANVERTPSDTPPAYVENAFQSREPQALCTACRRHHGSVTSELNCMRREILEIREVARQLSECLPAYSAAVKNRNAILFRDRKSMEGIPEEVAALRALRKACGGQH
jgi:hypothetical protein